MGLAHVFVTNKNTFEHEDSYDGELFAFPIGEWVLVPLDAAEHMFGYGLQDKTDTLSRLGWSTILDPQKKQLVNDPEGARKLANFVFEEATIQPRSALARALDAKVPGAELV